MEHTVMLEVVTRKDCNASTATNSAHNFSSRHAVRQQCIPISLTLVGKISPLTPRRPSPGKRRPNSRLACFVEKHVVL